jgi:hypothetical protein
VDGEESGLDIDAGRGVGLADVELETLVASQWNKRSIFGDVCAVEPVDWELRVYRGRRLLRERWCDECCECDCESSRFGGTDRRTSRRKGGTVKCRGCSHRHLPASFSGQRIAALLELRH